MLPDTLTDNYKAYIDKYCKENDVVVLFRRITTSETGIAHGEEPIHGENVQCFVEVSKRHLYGNKTMPYDHEIKSYADAIHWLEGGWCLKYFEATDK